MSPEARAREVAHRRKLFEEKFVRRGEDECWPWVAGQNQKGNGIFGIGALAATPTKPAHVVAWMLYRDASYDLNRTDVFHRLCGASNCINPRHMAIIGSNGLLNLAEVTRFIAARCPAPAAKLLLAAASEMELADNAGIS